mmetsp:Transcript_32986/g.39932  ORF Transcript_32986/g.39932 Transcript_32986/m.39932 type:complete len:479 (+) Transcript_32986:86-1522(+)
MLKYALGPAASHHSSALLHQSALTPAPFKPYLNSHTALQRSDNFISYPQRTRAKFGASSITSRRVQGLKSVVIAMSSSRKYESMSSLEPSDQSEGVKVWRGPVAGDISFLRLEEDAFLRPPGEGEVQVRVAAVGLNFADVFTCLGLYEAAPQKNYVPGLEFSGVVTAIGPPKADTERLEPEGIEVGSSVMGVTRFGAYSTRINTDMQLVRRLPENWTFTQGAAALVQGLTVWYGMSELGRLRAGDTVLIHSAAGGCGLRALAMCQCVGASSVAVVGSASKAEFLLKEFPELKSEQVIVRPKGRGQAAAFKRDLEQALSSVGANEGFSIIMDSLLGPLFQPGWDLLRKGGKYVIYGAASMTPQGGLKGMQALGAWIKLAWQWLFRPKLDLLSMPGSNKAVFGFNLIWMFDRLPAMSPLMDEMLRLQIPPPTVGHVFDFSDAKDALRLFQTGTTQGKVVLEVKEFWDHHDRPAHEKDNSI